MVPNWKKQNARRLDLINKQFDGGLSEAEQRELDHLQFVVGKKINELYPLPHLDFSKSGLIDTSNTGEDND